MNNTELTHITLALAGVIQAAVLVQTFAAYGKCDEAAFIASINSIYKIDADDVVSVYGNIKNVKLGLESLISLFSNVQSPKQRDISRYVVSLMKVQKNLMRDKAMLLTLQKKLHYAVSQVEFFNEQHPTVINNLGHIYTDTISQMKFRIQVFGAKEIINVPDNMTKIRALLLAGIRSAVLWQQLGGSHWQFLFQRKKIVKCAKKLLENIETE